MRDRSVQRKKEGNIKYLLVISPSRQPEQGLTASTFIPSPLKFQGTGAHGVTKIVCFAFFRSSIFNWYKLTIYRFTWHYEDCVWFELNWVQLPETEPFNSPARLHA